MATVAEGAASNDGFGSRGYRGYVLGTLLLVFIFNFIDRTVINILTEPIRETFQVEDWQMGLLGGPAFAFLYTFVGIPIARYSEGHNRVWIIAGSVALWSLMTALCGFATSFVALFLFRVGVSIGEAGCVPPSNSLISDYFAPGKRATALSIFALGIPLGSMIAAAFGGYISSNLDGAMIGSFLGGLGWTSLVSMFNWNEIEGWRIAFVLVGIPGLLLALAVRITIKEPPRGYTDPPGMQNLKPAGFKEVIAILRNKPAYWHVTMGVMLASFVGYGVGQFLTSFLIRTHGLSLQDAAINVVLLVSLMGAIGTFGSGYLADRFSDRHPKILVLMPMAGLTLATPILIMGYLVDSIWVVLPALMIGQLLLYTFLCPLYAVPTGVVDSRMRATAVAVSIFIINLLGYGLGPPVIGALSTFLKTIFLDGFGLPLTLEACQSAGLIPSHQAACTSSDASGLQWSIIIFTCFYLWGALHFYLASKTLQRDMVR